MVSKSTWIDLKSGGSAVIGGLIVAFAPTITAGVEVYGGSSLERQKYEISLIMSILSNEEIDPEEAADQLVFLSDIKAFKALRSGRIIERAKDPSQLPTFEVYQGELGANIEENPALSSDTEHN